MNHLVIIGNGFDLAHGLETSYKHFIIWYLKKVAKEVELNKKYEDDIIKISFDKKIPQLDGFYQNVIPPVFQENTLVNQPLEFLDILKKKEYTVKYKSNFIKELLNNASIDKWVDIEALYFNHLTILFKEHNSSDIKEKSKNENALQNILMELNNALNEIKKQLIDYLNSIQTQQFKLNSYIIAHFKKIHSQINKSENELVKYINFNYTKYPNEYLKYLNYNGDDVLYYIHGSLQKNSIDEIIFGYGDETTSLYHEIEEFNNKEFKKHMKSFGYAMNDHLQKTYTFLESDEYTVHIMGHSCGLSDRVLLKEIFENDNCKKIKQYYYQKSDGTNDFIEKYMDISMHFSIENKSKMRKKVLSLDLCEPLSTSKS